MICAVTLFVYKEETTALSSVGLGGRLMEGFIKEVTLSWVWEDDVDIEAGWGECSRQRRLEGSVNTCAFTILLISVPFISYL